MDKYETITIKTKSGKIMERRGLVVETTGSLRTPVAVAVGNVLYRYVDGTIGLFRAAGRFTTTMIRDVH